MASLQISFRIEEDEVEALDAEAQKRNQTRAALVRTFVLDGLARFDSVGEKILQSGENLKQQVDAIEAIAAATMHLLASSLTRQNKKNDGESDAAYAERLKEIYSSSVHEAIPKGALIVAALQGLEKQR